METIKRENTQHKRVLIEWAIAIILMASLAAIVAYSEIHQSSIPPPVQLASVHCVNEKAQDFHCFHDHFESITKAYGVKTAFTDLKSLYERDPFVVAQCHQFAHVIGNTASEMYPNISDAFKDGDSFCWSGYYHGVVERSASRFSVDTIPKQTNQFCNGVEGKARYSFDYFNCVHGLGHGFMLVAKNNLFDALDLCANFTGDWEKQSCYGGVFMENVMLDNREHHTDYLKPNDLLYPCNAVDERYKLQCYLMQTSYALTKNGRDFGKLFDLCERADKGYEDTCAQSIGRDASGQSVSNATQTYQWCALAHNPRQEQNCITGAVKDFISYHHGTREVMQYCALYQGELRNTCDQVTQSYATTL
jgi:hypothetical protein